MTLANNYQQYVTPLLDTTFKQAVGTLIGTFASRSRHANIYAQDNAPSTCRVSSRRRRCTAPLVVVPRVSKI